MKRALRIAALAAIPLALAACETASAPPAEPATARPAQPVALRLNLTGKTAPVLGAGGPGTIELIPEGAEEPVAMAFENGALAVQDLAPGRYTIARIGELQCRGLGFDVDPNAQARALGSLDANIVETEYYVALMSARPAGTDDVGALATRADASPAAVDAEPIRVREGAPCFVNRSGPNMTWQEVPLYERIMLGVLMAGLCAGSLAAGGFCAFGAGAVGF